MRASAVCACRTMRRNSTSLRTTCARRTAEAPEAGEVRRLSTTEARALFPPLRAGLAGVLVTGGARVDGRRLNVALLRAARALGADLREGRGGIGRLRRPCHGCSCCRRDVDCRYRRRRRRRLGTDIAATAWRCVAGRADARPDRAFAAAGQRHRRRWPVVLPQSATLPARVRRFSRGRRRDARERVRIRLSRHRGGTGGGLQRRCTSRRDWRRRR